MGHISKLTKEMSRSLEKAGTSAWAREPELQEQCVNGWTKTKFEDRNKVPARGIAKHGITVVPLHRVLAELSGKAESGLCGAAGTDLAELVEYYKAHVDLRE